VHTRSEKRDEHLRAPDFFDVETHPEIQFRVTGVEPNGDDLKVHGELTIKGTSRARSSCAPRSPASGPDPWGGERVGVAAYGEIDRRDFDLNWDVRTPRRRAAREPQDQDRGPGRGREAVLTQGVVTSRW